MSCIMLHLCACIYCFFPLFLPVVLETDAVAVIDYVPDDQPFAAEQQGKQKPLEHSDITHLSPSYACIRILLL